jgi:hypothetical protein
MIPEINGKLRQRMIKVPEEIWQVGGIKIFGKLIRSIVFSTDIATIKNINADAIIAVYPFPAHPAISQAIIMASNIPVFVGVGGGTTKGQRAVTMAIQAEHQGAYGLVLNAPIGNDVVEAIRKVVEIPIIVTICSGTKSIIEKRLAAQVDILNVAAAAKTPQIVAGIKKDFPHAIVMATGGKSVDSINATIESGADAITWTPPPTSQIFKGVMNSCRSMELGAAAAQVIADTNESQADYGCVT